MEKLFNSLNVGYMTNASFVKIPFKKKYIYILEKLLKLNCIDSFNIECNSIFIKLRYYKNKPLFFFNLKSKGGNKIYKKFCINSSNSYSTNLSLFFTSNGLLTLEEIIYKGIGGEHVVDILFLDKK